MMAQAQEDAAAAVTIPMADPRPSVPAPASGAEAGQKEKKAETLFGPNIGIVSTGPKWTEKYEKSSDELTPEIVKAWIAKSKQTNHVTTTLQALVNLKRPTLRLTPLEISPSDDPNHVDSQHHHALEFEFDCDAPKCSIRVDVLLAPSHPLAAKADELTENGFKRVTVYEAVVDGGFGRWLKLEDGAMLELGRYDNSVVRPSSSGGAGSKEKDGTIEQVVSASDSQPPNSHADASQHHQQHEGDEANARHRKRFTTFNALRRRAMNRSVAGPAIAVLDAESHSHPSSGTSGTPAHGADSSSRGNEEGKHEEDADDVGVRVTIRLSALDAEGKELSVVNAQTTYLHVVRFGAPPPQPIVAGETEEQVEDTRPWVVKVVKRSATIGPHTFHLHEIYGLSSSSTSTSHPPPAPPPAPLPSEHVYPPTVAPPAPAPVPREEEPSSECLLCLSAPREVVLLPCRHLVACRDCAVNMIEFGAGGTIVHADSEPAGAGAGPGTGAGTNVGGEGALLAEPEGEHGEGLGAGEGASAAAGSGAVEHDAPRRMSSADDGQPPPSSDANAPQPVPPPMTTNPRRKRKAKGWFCPVCRQPYTSMLRITTAPPFVDDGKDDARESSELENTMASATLASAPDAGATATANPPAATGPLRGLTRPAFLRFGRSGGPQPDLERGVVPGSAAAV